MTRYTYCITYYYDVDAENEDQAREQAEESCPVEADRCELYEVEDISLAEYVADSINDERRIHAL